MSDESRPSRRQTGSSFINRIVAVSLEQRILVVVADGAPDRRRRLRLEPAAGRRLSRSVAADGRDHHAVAGPRGRGGRAADHGADRARDERHAEGEQSSARSRSTACPTSTSRSTRTPTAISRASRCSSGSATSSLPTGVTPSVSPLTSPSGLIYRYVLQSPDRSPMELKTFEDWVVEPQFRSVPGVADDSGFGGGTMQYQVLLDQTDSPARASRRSRSRAALGANNGNAGGGFYSRGRPVLLRARPRPPRRRSRTSATSSSPCTTASRCWSRTSARSTIGIAPRLGQFGFDKQNDAVEGVILLRTGEQTQDVLKGVEAKTQELNTSILPKDVKVVPFYDRCDLVHADRAHGRGQPAARHAARRRRC